MDGCHEYPSPRREATCGDLEGVGCLRARSRVSLRADLRNWVAAMGQALPVSCIPTGAGREVRAPVSGPVWAPTSTLYSLTPRGRPLPVRMCLRVAVSDEFRQVL